MRGGRCAKIYGTTCRSLRATLCRARRGRRSKSAGRRRPSRGVQVPRHRKGLVRGRARRRRAGAWAHTIASETGCTSVHGPMTTAARRRSRIRRWMHSRRCSTTPSVPTRTPNRQVRLPGGGGGRRLQEVGSGFRRRLSRPSRRTARRRWSRPQERRVGVRLVHRRPPARARPTRWGSSAARRRAARILRGRADGERRHQGGRDGVRGDRRRDDRRSRPLQARRGQGRPSESAVGSSTFSRTLTAFTGANGDRAVPCKAKDGCAIYFSRSDADAGPPAARRWRPAGCSS